MSKLAIFDTSIRMYTRNSDEIRHCISTLDCCYPGLDIEEHIFLPNHILDYINDGSDDVLKYGDIFFADLKSLSMMGNNLVKHGRLIDSNTGFTVNAISISKGLGKNIRPLQTSRSYHRFEYDVHACVIAMLNYQYYFSKDKSQHYNDPVVENPLRNVEKVYVSANNNSTTILPRKDGNMYLCSRKNKNSELYTGILKYCRLIISRCWYKYGYDISRLVYGVLLGSIYICMPSSEYNRHMNISRTLMQISSYNEIFEGNVLGSVFFDSINFINNSILNNLRESGVELRPKDPTKRVIGRRYIKFNENENVSVFEYGMTTEPEQFVKDITNVTSGNLGWYTYSPITMKLDKRMFHIDIHSAYPVRYYKETGKTISKSDFGKLKCGNIYLYQKIRKEIEVYSNEILNSFEHELLYWKTDGGIVLVDNDDFIKELKMKFPDIAVEEIIDTKPMMIHPSIGIPESLKNTTLYKSRVFAYKVYKQDSITIVYANMFEKHKDSILDFNDMSGLSKYNANLLSEVLTNRRE